MSEEQFWKITRLVLGVTYGVGTQVKASIGAFRRPQMAVAGAAAFLVSGCMSPVDMAKQAFFGKQSLTGQDNYQGGQYYNPRGDRQNYPDLPPPPAGVVPPYYAYGAPGYGYGAPGGGGYVAETEACRQRRGLGVVLGPECRTVGQTRVQQGYDGRTYIEQDDCKTRTVLGPLTSTRCRPGSVTTLTPIVPQGVPYDPRYPARPGYFHGPQPGEYAY